jgi:hypothetical protein
MFEKIDSVNPLGGVAVEGVTIMRFVSHHGSEVCFFLFAVCFQLLSRDGTGVEGATMMHLGFHHPLASSLLYAGRCDEV